MKILDYSEEDIPRDKAGLGSSGLMAQSSWGSALTSGESRLLLLTVLPLPLLPKPVSGLFQKESPLSTIYLSSGRKLEFSPCHRGFGMNGHL